MYFKEQQRMISIATRKCHNVVHNKYKYEILLHLTSYLAKK